MKTSFGYLWSLLLWITISCQSNPPSIEAPLQFSIGDSFNLVATGLNPSENYIILATKTDQFGRTWSSSATFTASAQGDFDLSKQEPIEGSYSGVDSYGLLWSMTMPDPPAEDWQAPTPADFAEISFTLVQNEGTLAETICKQVIIPDLRQEELQDELYADIFFPKEASRKSPAILLLGGSGGGKAWARRVGSLLANEGYVTIALAYFNEGQLPKHLAQIPLEYVDQAIDYLLNHPAVDTTRLGILGYSKGAELGLLMASRRKEIKSIVAIAPGSAVFQGFKPPKYPVISSWSWQGEDLTFVPNAYDKKFFETFDGMYLWYRTLQQHEALESAAIPVERINGDVLLLSGVEDQIWPSTYMAEQIIARLHINDFTHKYSHQAFHTAGHGIAEPPGHPTTNVAAGLGGTPQGNATARAVVWASLRDFFKESLQP